MRVHSCFTPLRRDRYPGSAAIPGYSFTSQAIGELMAIGAPSERLVDPLFITYGVLVLAFGVGVVREGLGRSRALRVAGALLIAYAAIGFTGPHSSQCTSAARAGWGAICRTSLSPAFS